MRWFKRLFVRCVNLYVARMILVMSMSSNPLVFFSVLLSFDILLAFWKRSRMLFLFRSITFSRVCFPRPNTLNMFFVWFIEKFKHAWNREKPQQFYNSLCRILKIINTPFTLAGDVNGGVSFFTRTFLCLVKLLNFLFGLPWCWFWYTSFIFIFLPSISRHSCKSNDSHSVWRDKNMALINVAY